VHKERYEVVFVMLCRRGNPVTFSGKKAQKVGGFAKKHRFEGATGDFFQKYL